jgi:hypothetical protein
MRAVLDEPFLNDDKLTLSILEITRTELFPPAGQPLPGRISSLSELLGVWS